MTQLPLITVGMALCGGMALGCGYFALLYKALRLHEAAAPLAAIMLLHVLRGAVAVVTFWALAQVGAWALLAGLAGFVMARTAAQYRVGGR